MIQILKYYVLHRHGLPILAGILALLVLSFFVFEDNSVGNIIYVVLMFPYLDMFSNSLGQNELKNIDESLPLSFNKIWLVKTLCLSLYLFILLGINTLVLYLNSEEFIQEMTGSLLSGVIMLMLLFVFGKFKLYKKGNRQLIILTMISLVIFVLMLFGIKLMRDIITVDNFILYGIATFIAPIVLINLIDYGISSRIKVR